MFELLLQADRSLSEGLLDQAERTYWQLIEADPTNSIAVAGLAHISLQRGDERLARTFADRALDIDPDSIAARRVIRALEEGEPAPAGPSPPDLQLRGAERLEALSRRRAAAQGREGAGPTGAKRVSTRPTTAGPSARGGATPDELEPMPSEPLRERRRAGRLAAAAAAAAADEPGHTRHEPHRAMPSGRHLYQPEMLKAPASDPFSEAEMAAAVAAVDSLDETVIQAAPEVEMPAEVEAGVEAPAQAEVEAAADLEDVLEAVDATEARESVALRLALLSPSVEPSGPEAPAEQPGDRSLEAGAAERSASGGEVDADASGAYAGATSAASGPVASASEQPPNAETSARTPREPESPPRKKGLFRRFRGS